MVSIHNYGVRHRYGPLRKDEGPGPGHGEEHSEGPDHWSSDDPVEGDRPLRAPAGSDKAGAGRKKTFPGMPGRRKFE
jgi:hypothetical protein